MRHNILVLHESSNNQIYKCKCCNHYNLNYRNLFFQFTKKEFETFTETLRSLRPHHFECTHPEGLKALILNTKHPGKLGFTKEEVSQIIDEIEQALVMEEVFASLPN
jgi:hypothetical protein|tara:strand:+ start:868 stop:1188 length:321 start_codon:yes stop_codon:yes gene_type:complete